MLHVGDIGKSVKIELKDGCSAFDLTGYNTIEVVLRSPGGKRVVLAGTVEGDPACGILLSAGLSAGQIDFPGRWLVQVRLVNSSTGADFVTEAGVVNVSEKI